VNKSKCVVSYGHDWFDTRESTAMREIGRHVYLSLVGEGEREEGRKERVKWYIFVGKKEFGGGLC